MTVDEFETCLAAGGGGACWRYGFGRGKPCIDEFKDKDELFEWVDCEYPADFWDWEKMELMKDRWFRSS